MDVGASATSRAWGTNVPYEKNGGLGSHELWDAKSDAINARVVSLVRRGVELASMSAPGPRERFTAWGNVQR